MDVEMLASDEEQAVRARLLEAHPNWTVQLDGTRRWVVRDRAGILLARHMDIVVAGRNAEEQR